MKSPQSCRVLYVTIFTLIAISSSLLCASNGPEATSPLIIVMADGNTRTGYLSPGYEAITPRDDHESLLRPQRDPDQITSKDRIVLAGLLRVTQSTVKTPPAGTDEVVEDLESITSPVEHTARSAHQKPYRSSTDRVAQPVGLARRIMSPHESRLFHQRKASMGKQLPKRS